MMNLYPIERAFTFIESGPVILVTTADKYKPNIMTMSWHMLLDFSPIIACSIGPWNYSYELLKKNRECVLNIPGSKLLKKTVDIGNCSGETIDKFKKFKLTPLASKSVKAPIIKESLFALECKVIKQQMLHGAYLFIMKGIKAHHNTSLKDQIFHAKGDGTFFIDGKHINLRKRMTMWQDCI